MTEQQIPHLMGKLVEHQSAFKALSTEDAQWAIQNTKKAIAICVEAIKNRTESSNEKLLEHFGRTTVPATKKFVVCDRIKSIKEKSGQTIICGKNFDSWFSGMTVEAAGKTELRYKRLRESSVDKSIIVELGGEAEVETSIAEMLALLEMQANSEQGALFTNGCVNIFYVRDIDGVLRAVFCRWDSHCWLINAHSIDNLSSWNSCSQVFFRNSSKS